MLEKMMKKTNMLNDIERVLISPSPQEHSISKTHKSIIDNFFI